MELQTRGADGGSLCDNELSMLSLGTLQSVTMSTVHTVTIEPLGASFGADEHTAILHAAESAGLDLPSSCRNGTCRTCICRLRAGEVAYLVEWPGLSLDEKREGYILPCVAVAKSSLVIETPLARRVAFVSA